MSIEPDFIVSRRTTLRWLAASIASSTMLTGCGGSEEEEEDKGSSHGTPNASLFATVLLLTIVAVPLFV